MFCVTFTVTCGARGLEALAHALAHGLRAVARRIAELDRDRDVAVVGDLQALQHVRGNVVDLHHGVLKTREGRAKRFGGDHELLLHRNTSGNLRLQTEEE